MSSFLAKEGRLAVNDILASFIKEDDPSQSKVSGLALPVSGTHKAALSISCGMKKVIAEVVQKMYLIPVCFDLIGFYYFFNLSDF